MYLCPHLVRRKTLKSLRASIVHQYVCSKRNRASVPFIHRDKQNIQDIFLNGIFLQLNIYKY